MAKKDLVADETAQQTSTGPVPMAEPAGGWPADEFTGIGGSYVRDPFTGIRSRVAPDAPAVPAAE